MNVWIKITRKRVLCHYCNQFIETSEFQVVCVYFMKLRNSSKTWTKSMHFHAKDPSCWVDRAIVQLEMKPYSENRGRKANPISDDVKVQRQKILRRRASVIQRINHEMDDGKRPAKIEHLTGLLEQLAVEIEPLGGVPESWR